MKKISVQEVAEMCHEANMVYCSAIGDNSQMKWSDAPQWQKDSAVEGVVYHLTHPDSTPADSHNSWLDAKIRDGWQFGEVKDAVKKTHPCIVPYSSLPEEQKAKDKLFLNIVRSVEYLVAGFS